MLVADILAAKSDSVVTTNPNERVAIVTHRLRAKQIGAAVVSPNDRQVAGIISERDIIYGIAQYGSNALDMPVASLMNRSPEMCSPDDTIVSIMARITNRRVRHIVVVEDSRLTGVVSIGDVLKHRLDELQTEANVLRDYAIAVH